MRNVAEETKATARDSGILRSLLFLNLMMRKIVQHQGLLYNPERGRMCLLLPRET